MKMTKINDTLRLYRTTQCGDTMILSQYIWESRYEYLFTTFEAGNEASIYLDREGLENIRDWINKALAIEDDALSSLLRTDEG